MADRIEPPILMSRLMTFVFATALVVAAVLFVTLYKMFPLNRPQVFFLMTQPRDNLEITIHELPTNNEYLDIYKRTFIREYIRARNEVVPNAKIMRTKWNNDANGVVYAWSSDSVYSDFTETNMFRAWMNETPDFVFACPVEFQNGAITPLTDDTFTVKFSYFCENNDGQLGRKDYTIRLKLDTGDGTKIKWTDRLNNPLGIRVSEYVVESENGDPLNTGYLPN